MEVPVVNSVLPSTFHILLPKSDFSWFPFLSEKADLILRPPRPPLKEGCLCPDQERNACQSLGYTEQMLLFPLPNGKLCLNQNTELHAEVKWASAQKTLWSWVHLATMLAFHVKLGNGIKIVHSQLRSCFWLGQVFLGQVSAPQDLVSSFQRCSLSPKTSAVGQSMPPVLCLCLIPQTTPSGTHRKFLPSSH